MRTYITPSRSKRSRVASGILSWMRALSASGVSPPSVAGTMQARKRVSGHEAVYDISLCSGMVWSDGYSVEVKTLSSTRVRGVDRLS